VPRELSRIGSEVDEIVPLARTVSATLNSPADVRMMTR
jgi:hypothetical protein